MDTSEYTWHDKEAKGWRIDEGKSRILIAEGPGYSRQIGEALFFILARRPVTSKKECDG
jgi:hypothetical protein